jgi:kynurenine formamidase
MVIVENLRNLSALPETSFLFSCLPLRIDGGDGSPVRAVGLLLP